MAPPSAPEGMSVMTRKSARSESKPKTVAERRRSLRATRGVASPGLAKTATLDLTKPSARKALTGIYPRPESDVMLDATPELERAALEYVEQRDAETLAGDAKEVAGNLLCNAIGKNLGIRGDGWEARWDMSKGSVDWDGVVKELNIPPDVLERHRKPEKRVLLVKELAEEG